jgi:hypothetical protein
MKTTLRLSLLLFIIIITYSCGPNKKLADSKSVILPLSGTIKITDGSIVYALPRTVFTVNVEMERVIEIPGPYARYAGEMLGITDAILSESESWSIKGIRVKTHSEADPSEYYVIQSNTLFQTNVLSLKKEGLILDLDPGTFSSPDTQMESRETDLNHLRSFDLGSDEYFLSQSDTAYKRLAIDSTFIRIPYVVEKKKRLSLDQLAEKAAKRLIEMREGKHLILTGEATVFPQNEAAINEINRLEKEYTELFSGKIWRETKTFTYQIIPKKDMEKSPSVIFQFSDQTGPAAGSSKGGVPVTVELLPEQKTKDLVIIPKSQADKTESEYDKLYYRLPDVVNMKIVMGSEVLYNSRKLIFQFGTVIQLPANYIIGR